MKRKILFVFGLLLGAVFIPRMEAASILLKNAESSPFYFVIDPPELSGLDPSGTIFLGVLHEYFAESPEKEASFPFIKLPPDEIHKIEDLSEGTHLLLGFFAPTGSSSYPVRVQGIQAGGGIDERYYTMYAEPSLLSVRPGRGRLAGLESAVAAAAVIPKKEEEGGRPKLTAVRVRIDNDFSDWEQTPFLASFAPDFSPASFTRERYGGEPEAVRLSDSRYWQQGGTRLHEVKAVREGERLYLNFSAASALSANLSILLYLHGADRADRENRLTLEILPASPDLPGLVVLWQKGQAPLQVGSVASSGFFLEAEIELAVLGPLLAKDGIKAPTVDLTTCYFDRSAGTYEEFFFSTFSYRDVPEASDVEANG